jgi:hypothetical protein
MALTKSEAKTSRLIFYAAAIVAVLYGLLFLSMPERVFQLSHDPGVPTDAGWLRWTGATIAGEYQGAQWFIWVPILINLGLTVAMIWLITKQARPGGR